MVNSLAANDKGVDMNPNDTDFNHNALAEGSVAGIQSMAYKGSNGNRQGVAAAVDLGEIRFLGNGDTYTTENVTDGNSDAAKKGGYHAGDIVRTTYVGVQDASKNIIENAVHTVENGKNVYTDVIYVTALDHDSVQKRASDKAVYAAALQRAQTPQATLTTVASKGTVAPSDASASQSAPQDQVGEDPSKDASLLTVDADVAQLFGIGDEISSEKWLDATHKVRTVYTGVDKFGNDGSDIGKVETSQEDGVTVYTTHAKALAVDHDSDATRHAAQAKLAEAKAASAQRAASKQAEDSRNAQNALGKWQQQTAATQEQRLEAQRRREDFMNAVAAADAQSAQISARTYAGLDAAFSNGMAQGASMGQQFAEQMSREQAQQAVMSQNISFRTPEAPTNWSYKDTSQMRSSFTQPSLNLNGHPQSWSDTLSNDAAVSSYYSESLSNQLSEQSSITNQNDQDRFHNEMTIQDNQLQRGALSQGGGGAALNGVSELGLKSNLTGETQVVDYKNMGSVFKAEDALDSYVTRDLNLQSSINQTLTDLNASVAKYASDVQSYGTYIDAQSAMTTARLAAQQGAAGHASSSSHGDVGAASTNANANASDQSAEDVDSTRAERSDSMDGGLAAEGEPGAGESQQSDEGNPFSNAAAAIGNFLSPAADAAEAPEARSVGFLDTSLSVTKAFSNVGQGEEQQSGSSVDDFLGSAAAAAANAIGGAWNTAGDFYNKNIRVDINSVAGEGSGGKAIEFLDPVEHAANLIGDLGTAASGYAQMIGNGDMGLALGKMGKSALNAVASDNFGGVSFEQGLSNVASFLPNVVESPIVAAWNKTVDAFGAKNLETDSLPALVDHGIAAGWNNFAIAMSSPDWAVANEVPLKSAVNKTENVGDVLGNFIVGAREADKNFGAVGNAYSGVATGGNLVDKFVSSPNVSAPKGGTLDDIMNAPNFSTGTWGDLDGATKPTSQTGHEINTYVDAAGAIGAVLGGMWTGSGPTDEKGKPAQVLTGPAFQADGDKLPSNADTSQRIAYAIDQVKAAGTAGASDLGPAARAAAGIASTVDVGVPNGLDPKLDPVAVSKDGKAGDKFGGAIGAAVETALSLPTIVSQAFNPTGDPNGQAGKKLAENQEKRGQTDDLIHDLNKGGQDPNNPVAGMLSYARDAALSFTNNAIPVLKSIDPSISGAVQGVSQLIGYGTEAFGGNGSAYKAIGGVSNPTAPTDYAALLTDSHGPSIADRFIGSQTASKDALKVDDGIMKEVAGGTMVAQNGTNFGQYAPLGPNKDKPLKTGMYGPLDSLSAYAGTSSVATGFFGAKAGTATDNTYTKSAGAAKIDDSNPMNALISGVTGIGKNTTAEVKNASATAKADAIPLLVLTGSFDTKSLGANVDNLQKAANSVGGLIGGAVTLESTLNAQTQKSAKLLQQYYGVSTFKSASSSAATSEKATKANPKEDASAPYSN